MIVASARTEIADYLYVLVNVYAFLIFAYIVLMLLFSVGLRPPYSRTLDVVLGFLRDVTEPFLRLFRRFIPPMGPLDLSAFFALITLQVFNAVVVARLIHG